MKGSTEQRGAASGLDDETIAAEREGGPESTDEQAEPLLIVVRAPPDDFTIRAEGRCVVVWRPDPESTGARNTFSGEPTEPRTYEWTADALSVSAIVETEDRERALEVVKALRAVRPDAAALVVTQTPASSAEQPGRAGPAAAVRARRAAARAVSGDQEQRTMSDDDQRHRAAADGTLVRSGRLRDVVRLDIDEELQRLEAERRLYRLREFATSTDPVPILIHPAPDPDALSSAYAVRLLLGGSAERYPIVTLSFGSRPQNVRLSRLLDLKATEVTPAELGAFAAVIAVDHQPVGLLHADQNLAIIDHHPRERGLEANIADIRPAIGATATMLCEYLRVGEHAIPAPLATALLHGIKTDTADLTRGVSTFDVSAYGYLQTRADPYLLRRLERPSYPAEAARLIGSGLAHARVNSDLVSAWLGRIDSAEAHVAAELADLCMMIEGAIWVVVGAAVDDTVVLTIRHQGRGGRAGSVAKLLTDSVSGDGSGGGHASMARVEVSASAVPAIAQEQDTERAIDRLIEWVLPVIDGLRGSESARTQSSTITPNSSGA